LGAECKTVAERFSVIVTVSATIDFDRDGRLRGRKGHRSQNIGPKKVFLLFRAGKIQTMMGTKSVFILFRAEKTSSEVGTKLTCCLVRAYNRSTPVDATYVQQWTTCWMSCSVDYLIPFSRFLTTKP
jgi:hypothetical protein